VTRALGWPRRFWRWKHTRTSDDKTPVVDRESSGSELLSDAPLSDPGQDRLGRAPFARALARSILGMPTAQGFVFAIYAPWGAGKSTTLNFVLHYVQEQATTSQVVVVRFDPWWYAGEAQIVLQFFRQLMLALGRPDVPERLRKLGGRLETLARVVAPLSYVPYLQEWAKPVHRALRASGESVRAAADDLAKDADTLRKDIDQALRQQDTRILVVVDDLDRLSASEIRQMFRLIKAVADFPRTVYLLAFDSSVIARALGEVQHTDGHDYLEKIVQAPFNLPMPDEIALRRLLLDELNLVIGEDPPDLWDQRVWGNVFFGGIDEFIKTPRDVKRYVNALRMTYPVAKEEVNPIDFLAIECLRAFTPELYDEIRSNKALFAGGEDDPGLRKLKPDERRPRYEEILSAVRDVNERAATTEVLSRTFPKFASAFGSSPYGFDWESEWRRMRRVCSKDVFDVYFRLAPSLGTISNREMRLTLVRGGDSEAFERELLRFAGERQPDGRSRASAFLERMEDYTKDAIPLAHVEPIVRAMLNAGDQLVIPEDEVGFFSLHTGLRIARLTHQLLMRLPSQAERFGLLAGIVRGGRALYTVVYNVALIEGEHDEKEQQRRPTPPEDRLVNQEQAQQLLDVARGRIEAAAAEGTLVTVPNLTEVLYRWRDWAGEDTPRAWAARIVETDEGLARFLEGFLSRVATAGMGDKTSRVRWRVRADTVADFLPDIGALCNRASDILKARPSWLTDRQRDALTSFVEDCENPDHPDGGGRR
jgi:predicted KAP-like P-loop ATPase